MATKHGYPDDLFQALYMQLQQGVHAFTTVIRKSSEAFTLSFGHFLTAARFKLLLK